MKSKSWNNEPQRILPLLFDGAGAGADQLSVPNGAVVCADAASGDDLLSADAAEITALGGVFDQKIDLLDLWLSSR